MTLRTQLQTVLAGVFLLLVSTKATASDVFSRNHVSRNLLQRVVKSCNVTRNVDWFGSSIPSGYKNITSPGRCCKFCQETSNCNAWVWRFINRTCYLLDKIEEPRVCFLCTGGILNSTNDTVTKEGIDEFLQQCAEDGRTASRAAATAACLVLTNTCIPASKLFKRGSARSRSSPSISQFNLLTKPATATTASQFTLGPVDLVLQDSCATVFNETCKAGAFDQARKVDVNCSAILDLGPGHPTRRCRDANEARRLFNNQVEELCDVFS